MESMNVYIVKMQESSAVVRTMLISLTCYVASMFTTGTDLCRDGEVGLHGGKNEREGRVEICYNGVWGSVCDYGWDKMGANVVCTQLGYGHPG